MLHHHSQHLFGAAALALPPWPWSPAASQKQRDHHEFPSGNFAELDCTAGRAKNDLQGNQQAHSVCELCRKSSGAALRACYTSADIDDEKAEHQLQLIQALAASAAQPVGRAQGRSNQVQREALAEPLIDEA